jgi:hypothetical protein
MIIFLVISYHPKDEFLQILEELRRFVLVLYLEKWPICQLDSIYSEIEPNHIKIEINVGEFFDFLEFVDFFPYFIILPTGMKSVLLFYIKVLVFANKVKKIDCLV